jgi:hypothetical protein
MAMAPSFSPNIMPTSNTYYKKYSKQELVQLTSEIEGDPNNKETEGLYLYTKPARKKLAAIAEAIAWHLADERELNGNPIPVSGYSGRNSKKRH